MPTAEDSERPLRCISKSISYYHKRKSVISSSHTQCVVEIASPQKGCCRIKKIQKRTKKVTTFNGITIIYLLTIWSNCRTPYRRMP